MRIRQFALRACVTPLSWISRVSYFTETGWFRSVAEAEPVNAAGDPIPWWSYSAIAFVESRLQRNMTVVEFGAGNSTLWLGRRARRVVSIEVDKAWIERLSKSVPSNVTLQCFDDSYRGRYSDLEINGVANGEADVVIIDGLDRIDIALASHAWLHRSGVVVFDDFSPADKVWQRKAQNWYESEGFKCLAFSGLGPINDVPHHTCVFYRAENVFGI